MSSPDLVAWNPRSIPFLRLRNGKKVLSEVTRSKEITAMAHRFIALGGRFLISEVVDDQRNVEIELVAATYTNEGAPVGMAREVSNNGPELLKAVDRLVRAAHAKIDKAN